MESDHSLHDHVHTVRRNHIHNDSAAPVRSVELDMHHLDQYDAWMMCAAAQCCRVHAVCRLGAVVGLYGQ